MLVVHTADIHIGKNRKYPDYLEHTKLVLTALINKVRQKLEVHEDEAVWFVVAGDILDRKDTKTEEYFLLLNYLVSPCINLLEDYPNLEIFWIDGNHDRKDTKENPSLLFPLVGILPERFNVTVIHPKYYEHANLLAIPFGAYNQREFSQLIEMHHPKYVIAHECFSGIRTDLGYEPPRNQDKYIDAGNLQQYVTAIFLGDIHRHQKLSDNCWYSGSPITHDFGHTLPKGVLVYKIENDVVIDEPVLEPLDDVDGIKIRSHQNLGSITKSEDIPWDTLFNYKNLYINLEGSPEIYKEISDRMSDFFSSPLVNWEFTKKIWLENKPDCATVEDTDTENETETKVIVNPYYNDLVQQWIVLCLPHLTKEHQDECYKRLSKIFETRG